MSADTLRYDEKIGLMTGVRRASRGTRVYSDKDLARLRFIRRAQKMGFNLAEIAKLLTLRESPRKAKPQVQGLARQKLNEI
ncbi:MerR family DNA-binding protein [Marinobacter sp.]|uniref:MerR family DNA-binding protein n=1 Tax=Marinobacter sp. TaxID=50741 RepID=UPI003B5294D6